MIRSYEEILGSTYQIWCPIWDLWSTNSIRIIFWVSWRHNTLYDVIIAYKKIAKIYQIINIFTMMFVYHYLILPVHPQYLPRHAPLILQGRRVQKRKVLLSQNPNSYTTLPSQQFMVNSSKLTIFLNSRKYLIS